MKKRIFLPICTLLLVGMTACGGAAEYSQSSESSGDIGGQERPVTFEDYYDIDMERGFALKDAETSQGHYGKADETIFGREDVYEFTCTGWTGELQVSETALSTHNVNAPCATAPEARAYLEERGYEYVAIDFALSDGAGIGVYTYLPMRLGMTSELGGLSVKDGSALVATGNLLPEFNDRIQLFKDGYRIQQGIALEAGEWYTVVVQLQLDAEQSLQGLDSWVNVSLTNGNGGTVYVSSGRFYTNDTFAEDYGSEGEIAPEPVQDYYEFGAEEMVDVKNAAGSYVETQGEVYGRSGTYTHTGNGWTTEISAKETAFIAGQEGYHGNAQEARASCVAKEYKYVALTFALSEGASISVTSIIPETGAASTATGGLDFKDGGTLAYRATVDTDEEKAFYKVYANGEEEAIGSTVSDGVWYTVVVKILLDTSGNQSGANTWLNVSLGATGNGKPVYVSNVRYYTNESFATDFTTI